MYAIANQIAEDYATAKKILATDPDKVGDFMDAHAERWSSRMSTKRDLASQRT